ncbi:hypothetical protein Taro_045414 [Colocasia esculenta]|uniref:Uncharacterized protein n=1 Tax=Colocasia esculenta TaxID=4460 RepID=A0A843X4S1_COLES|nr:hypothetical protein [Colocasia esculenta]
MASSIVSGSLGGYSAEFLSAEQQERFTFVKTKLCGNKAVDVADLEKNGMISVVVAMRRMQWMGITTFSEHFGVDVSGAVVEKMGQAIRSRNLRKSGFSMVNGVWTKTSVAEGEPILGEAQDVQLEAVAVESEGPSAVAEPAAEEAAVPRGSQEITAISEVAVETSVAQENIAVAVSVRSTDDPLPTSSVAYVLRQVLDSIHSTPVIQNTGGSLVDQIVASGHIESSVLIDAPIQGEQGRIGEQNIEKEGASQGAHSEDASVNEEHIEVPIEVEEQVERRSPSKKTTHRRQKKILKKLHLKPILKRLDDQGEVLTPVQSAVSSVIVRHESMSNDISQISNAMKWFNKELRSMKVMVSEILKSVGPKDPTPPECEPSRQSEGNAGPSGPIGVDLVELPSGPSVDAPAGPSGPSIAVQPSENLPIEDSDICQGSRPEKETLNPVEPVAERADQAVAPEPPASSTLPTPAAPSAPSSSTAPPAPTTFKRPRPRSVSSPQPFPSQFASSPISSNIVPSPPSSPQLPPASSSARPSSSGPSSSGPSALPTITPASIFNPPTPPSFITIIPEGAQLTQVEIQDIKDEFEVAILHSVLAVGTHTHRTGSSSPVSKKRRLTSTHPISSDLCYPPLWFSLSISNKQKLIYEEYLQKAQQSKIFSMTEAKSEEQWARSNRDVYSQFREFKLPDIHLGKLLFPFMNDVVFLPPLHALIMDSSVGSLIFERAARVMARLFVQDGRDLSFPRFVFKQYLQGHIKADVLAPILSECERLSPADWTKLYPLSAQMLGDLNASQASSNQPPLSPGEFLDANFLHLIRNSYLTWVKRYKDFFALKKELRSLQIDYPLKIEAFLRFASFGSFLTYKLALGSAKAITI